MRFKGKFYQWLLRQGFSVQRKNARTTNGRGHLDLETSSHPLQLTAVSYEALWSKTELP